MPGRRHADDDPLLADGDRFPDALFNRDAHLSHALPLLLLLRRLSFW